MKHDLRPLFVLPDRRFWKAGAVTLVVSGMLLTGFVAARSDELPRASNAAAPDAGGSFAQTHPAAVDAEKALEEAMPEGPEDREQPLRVPSRLREPPLADARPLPPERDLLSRARLAGDGRLHVKVGQRDEALTIDVDLQERLTRIFREYQTPYAAVVAIEPSTGRVLAMSEHSERMPSLNGLASRPLFPAASIFKIVTAAALLERGVSPGEEVCTHGAKRRVSLKHLSDSGRDRDCLTLSDAFARSANGVFAKLTHRHLTAERLLRQAEQTFYWNRPLGFPIAFEASPAAIPKEPLALAETGAGFGDVFLSPLHGALVASVAANGGYWREPIVLQRALAEPPPPTRVLSAAHARALAEMMEDTVTKGTARRTFRERGYKVPGAVGKTGSLADKRPVFRDYSWFVGYAPKSNPKIAVAAVVVNDMEWRIRATYVGREALRLGLAALEQEAEAAGKREPGTQVLLRAK